MWALAAAATVTSTAAPSAAGEPPAAAATVTSTAAPSAAGEPPAATRLPVAYAERPLALPAMTLAPGGRFNVFTVRPGDGRSEDPWYFLSAGARFGIIDELEVELTPFQSVLAPDFFYGGSAGLTADFLDGPVELGARLRVFWHEDGAVFTPAVPLRFHVDAGIPIRIDTGAAVSVDTDARAGLVDFSTVPVNVEPGVPARVAFQLVDPFWVGLQTGLGIVDFAEADDTTFVPLGFGLGGTVPGDEGPVLDIEAGFSFPQLFLTGDPDAVVSDVWNVGLQLQGYIYL